MKTTIRSPDIYEIVGDFGRWQIQLYIPLFLACILNAMQNLSVTFLAPNLDYTCISSPFQNDSYSTSNISVNDFILNDNTFGIVTSDQCKIYSLQNTSSDCDEWSYNITSNGRTIVSEWNLVCDKEWLISLTKSLYMMGSIISIYCMGQLSDWFGRYPILLIAYAIMTLAGILSPLSTSFVMFGALRFFSGLGNAGFYTTGFILLMEVVGPNWRAELGFGFQIAWSIGYILLPGVAWLLKDWVYLQCALTIPNLLLVFFCWVVPESPRWLLTQKKWDRFDRIVDSAAKKNNHTIDNNTKKMLMEFQEQEFVASEVKKKTIIDVLKTPYLRFRLLLLFFIWVVNSFVYYGLSYNTNELAGNPYMNFFLSGIVEFPAVAIFTYGVRTLGRMKTMSIGMIIVGVFCALIIAVPTDLTWLIVTFAMIAKLCITGTYNIVYICTAELFPTVVRNTALGYCSTFARLGPITAPFVRDLGKVTYSFVPELLNAALTIVAGFTVLALPETKNKVIPDTFEDKEFSEVKHQQTSPSSAKKSKSTNV